jgi:hypothetical protein
MRVLVVVPALNEEEAIGGLLDELRAHAGAVPFDVAVIDDGSTDHTAAIAAARGARVLRLCRNLGIGGAVQAGIRLAQREGYDAALQVDGDGQHPPSEVPRLLAALQQPEAPDVVVGSRYLTPGGYRSTLLRRLGGWWLALWLRLVAGVKVSDPTSGFRAYGPRALLLYERDYPYDFPEPESLATAAAAGLVVAEAPVTMRQRQGGRSSIGGFRAFYYMVKVTLAVLLSHHRSGRRHRLRPGPEELPAAARGERHAS